MLANCAAMNIPVPHALDMTMWQYEATLVRWNEAHEVDPAPEPASTDQFMETNVFFAAHPELLN